MAEQLSDDGTAYPEKLWHEYIGPVLWWKFPVVEAPYVGEPTWSDWPGYHTHWTRLPPIPHPVTKFRRRLENMKRHGGERTRAKLTNRTVLIWSGEHNAWWRPYRSGYTTFRSAAGAYTFDDAWQATTHCGPEKRIIFEVIF